jgi:hypothetical protein
VTTFLIVCERELPVPHRLRNYTVQGLAELERKTASLKREPAVKCLRVFAELEEWRKNNLPAAG